MKRWKLEVIALLAVSAGLLAFIFRNWICGCGAGYHSCCVDETGACWTRMLGIGMFSLLSIGAGATTLVSALGERLFFPKPIRCKECGKKPKPEWSLCPYCGMPAEKR